MEAWIVAYVVWPGGRFGEDVDRVRRTGFIGPTRMIRVVGQCGGDEFPAGRRKLLPGYAGDKTVAGRVPGLGERRNEEKQGDEQ
ncbi:MAG: hypothetical protein HT580_14575 [Dechloromonas sp.]|nr:MAG: hypothetical protein HT580_14575 [Dechloromonas sp.]